ncbi:unnamed protein product [Blepharisma stoltei]|uniref:Myb-like DNA-binding domain containing protein n=1 Tax=Blepharisma stoltei TaxID=1481888 RepID=A0AAU9JAT1_9CILI|nr:unnamed protein product [Blepharisma stoltei]
MATDTPIFRQGKWSPEEDKALKTAVEYYGEENWNVIANEVEQRNAKQCRDRYMTLKAGPKKGPWQPHETAKLLEWVKYEGPTEWQSCALQIPGRSARQCFDRWRKTLKPGMSQRVWTSEENYILFEMHKRYGPQWSLIAKSLKERTAGSVRKHFFKITKTLENYYTAPKRKLSKESIVPKTPHPKKYNKNNFISKENTSTEEDKAKSKVTEWFKAFV